MSPNPKVTTAHLKLMAVIYVRQSTAYSVKFNTMGGERQYQMEKTARELGWVEERIRVVDGDQAKSGATTAGRNGFKALVNDIIEGRVGAVFCLEASRLARNNSDFLMLVQLCFFTHTLIADEDGIYDPRDINDRMLLGIKGTVAEVEHHLIFARMQGARRELAKEGKLRFFPPTGYVYNNGKELILDPDEDVRRAVRLAFDSFQRLGSACAVVKYFKEQNLTFPTRARGGPRRGRIEWKPLTGQRLLGLLHSPCFAGAYVYGQRRSETRVTRGATIIEAKSRQVYVRPEDWKVVIPDAHEGYITWDQFWRNKKKLADNVLGRSARCMGAPRQGRALLQGLALCGKCGRRMSPWYNPRTLKPSPTYLCQAAARERGEENCQRVPGGEIETEVTQLFIRAFAPAQLELSMRYLEEAEEQVRQVNLQRAKCLKRAKEEADEASVRLNLIDARKQSHAFRRQAQIVEEAEAEVARLEREYNAAPAVLPYRLNADQHKAILDLAQDVGRVWHAETTSWAERKNLLRLIIDSVTLTREGPKVHAEVWWRTGACSSLEITLTRKPWVTRTDPKLLELIRTLGVDHTEQQIADHLNSAGFKSKTRRQFTKKLVKKLRHRYRYVALPNYKCDSDTYSMSAAALILGVNVKTVHSWCKQGRFELVRKEGVEGFQIRLTAEVLDRLRAELSSVRCRRGEDYYRDLSHKVTEAYDNGDGTLRGVASRFGVSLAFVTNSLRRRRRTGNPSAPLRSQPRLSDAAVQLILCLVSEQSNITLPELCSYIKQDFGITVSISTMSKTLIRLGMPRQKRLKNRLQKASVRGGEHRAANDSI